MSYFQKIKSDSFKLLNQLKKPKAIFTEEFFKNVIVLFCKIMLHYVDCERLSSRTSFQLEDEVLDTSKP